MYRDGTVRTSEWFGRIVGLFEVTRGGETAWSDRLTIGSVGLGSAKPPASDHDHTECSKLQTKVSGRGYHCMADTDASKEEGIITRCFRNHYLK